LKNGVYHTNDAQYEAKDGHDYLRYDDFSFPEWGRWPNPKGMVDQLHRDGLKVLLWQIPIHKHLYGIAHAQKDQDEQAMLAAGYPVKRRNGEPYRIPYNWFKDCLILDFTNPGARKWWFRKRQYLLDEVGVDGFKTDGGECVYGNDLLFDNGATGAEMRNLYPNAYIGSYFDFVREYVRDGLTFSRAGYSGAQRIPLHWAGDERSTYDAFRSSIVAGLTSGMSGVPFWGWDLGGFHGDIPTAELFIRSTQMAAFCPIMQYHAESKGEFNQDRTPWNIAERMGMPLVLDLYKKFADMRMNLLPYIYEQAVISSTEGIPMMQAMFAAYPEDSSCSELTEQYMFGDSMLVAPVTREGEVTKEIYFPNGKWISLFENVEITGSCMRKSAAALPDIPVYIKGDSIISLNLSNTYKLGSHVGNRTDCYEQLTFMIYVTDLIQYRFSDDLGHVVDIRVEKQPGKLQVTVSKLGDSAITLIFRNVQEVSKVVTDNDKLVRTDGLSSLLVDTYCVENGNLYIKADKQEEQWQIDFLNVMV
jgi:alpha-D-xyloside xylohydrolase